MKKILVLMLVMVMTTAASATIIDLVKVDIGQSGGRMGDNTGDKLQTGDIIGLKIVLNYNAYPSWTSYDGYALSSFDLDLYAEASSASTIDTSIALDMNGNPTNVIGAHGNLSPFSYTTDADGFSQLTGVATTPVQGLDNLVYDICLTIVGYQSDNLLDVDLSRIGLTEVSTYFDDLHTPNVPFPNPPGWFDISQGEIGSLVLHVVPEPMTIALLGLGGLFLRRRK